MHFLKTIPTAESRPEKYMAHYLTAPIKLVTFFDWIGKRRISSYFGQQLRNKCLQKTLFPQTGLEKPFHNNYEICYALKMLWPINQRSVVF